MDLLLLIKRLGIKHQVNIIRQVLEEVDKLITSELEESTSLKYRMEVELLEKRHTTPDQQLLAALKIVKAYASLVPDFSNKVNRRVRFTISNYLVKNTLAI